MHVIVFRVWQLYLCDSNKPQGWRLQIKIMIIMKCRFSKLTWSFYTVKFEYNIIILKLILSTCSYTHDIQIWWYWYQSQIISISNSFHLHFYIPAVNIQGSVGHGILGRLVPCRLEIFELLWIIFNQIKFYWKSNNLEMSNLLNA